MNGNGRLARLLFAYSLMRDGFPLPVALECDTNAARDCYLEAIERVRSSDSGVKQPVHCAEKNKAAENQDFKLYSENYKPKHLDYLVQLGLFSMFSLASTLESKLLAEVKETTT